MSFNDLTDHPAVADQLPDSHPTKKAGMAYIAAYEGKYGVGDARIVGGHHHGLDARGRRGAAVHVLDHRAAGNLDERFPRQTCRVVSCGDDGDDGRRGKRAVEGIAESDRVHGES